MRVILGVIFSICYCSLHQARKRPAIEAGGDEVIREDYTPASRNPLLILADAAAERSPRYRRVRFATPKPSREPVDEISVLLPEIKLLALNLAMHLRLQPFPEILIRVAWELISRKSAMNELDGVSPATYFLLDAYIRRIASYQSIDSRVHMELLKVKLEDHQLNAPSFFASITSTYPDIIIKDPLLDPHKIEKWYSMTLGGPLETLATKNFAVNHQRHVVVEIPYEEWIERIVLPEMRSLQSTV